MPQNEKQSSIFLNDQPSEDDDLGFDPYVEALTEFLTDKYTRPPLTVSVEGEWGSGKSSFLKQLQKKLKANDENYLFVWFNPWRYTENEALWAAFAVEFEKQIFEKASFWKNFSSFLWVRKLQFRAMQLDWQRLGYDIIKLIFLVSIPILAARALPSILGKETLEWANSLSLILGIGLALIPGWDILKEFGTKLSKNLMDLKIKNYLKERPNYEGKIPFLDRFHKDLESFAKTLAGNNKIFIFIDDLDRCDAVQAVELMQALNLMISDKMKAVFILAIDRRKVAAGITVKNSEFINILDSGRYPLYYGYEFIDKFIQLPFLLPKPKEEDIDKLFDKLTSPNKEIPISKTRTTDTNTVEIILPSPRPQINEARSQQDVRISPPRTIHKQFEKHLGEVKAVLSEVAPLLQNNPRKIKKFLNIFRLQIHLGSRTGVFGFHNDVEAPRATIYQLGKFLACAYIWPDFVSNWARYPDFMWDFVKAAHRIENEGIDPELIFSQGLKELRGFSNDEFNNYKATILKWIKLPEIVKFVLSGRDEKSLTTVPIHLILAVSPVYESTDLAEQSPPKQKEEIRLGEDWPDADKVFSEILHYLNTNREDGQRIYILDGVSAELAYSMRKEGHSLAAIKAAIDNHNSPIDNISNGEQAEYRVRERLFDEIPGNVDEQTRPFDDIGKVFERKNPHTGEWEEMSEDDLPSHPDWQEWAEARQNEAAEQLRKEVDALNPNTEVISPNELRTAEAILEVAKGRVKEIKEELTSLGKAEEQAERIKQKIELEALEEARLEKEKKKADFLEKAPQDLTLEEAYAIAPHDTAQILDIIEEELNSMREPAQPRYELYGHRAIIAYDDWRKGISVAETKRKLDEGRKNSSNLLSQEGQWADPDETEASQPEREANLSLDSWENIDRKKNFDTGEEYTNEEWAEIQKKQEVESASFTNTKDLKKIEQMKPSREAKIIEQLEMQLNTLRDEIEEPYVLKGALAKIAYDNWVRNVSIHVTKQEIDSYLRAYLKSSKEELPQQYSEDHLG